MLLFVYGTLMEGYYNHDRARLNDEQKVCDGAASGALFDVGHYPCMSVEHDGVVKGEIYDVKTDRTAAFIRAMETGAGFAETEVMVRGIDAKYHICTTYTWTADQIEQRNLPRIDIDDYRRYRAP